MNRRTKYIDFLGVTLSERDTFDVLELNAYVSKSDTQTLSFTLSVYANVIARSLRESYRYASIKEKLRIKRYMKIRNLIRDLSVRQLTTLYEEVLKLEDMSKKKAPAENPSVEAEREP